MASEVEVEEGHGDGLAELVNEMDEFFNIGHLQRLMREGNWDGALSYVDGFIPNSHPDAISIQGGTLFRFLLINRFFAKVVAGADDSETQRIAQNYKLFLGHRHSTISHGALRIRCIMLSVLSDTFRASMDWNEVRSAAAQRIHILVERTPELKRHLLYQNWRLYMPHKVLPIGFSFRQRRHVKKRGRRPSKYDLTRVFQSIREKRLFFPSDSDGPSVDESLTRGRHFELYLESFQRRLKRSSDQSGKEDAPGAPVSSTVCGILTEPFKNFSISSVANADHTGNSGTIVSQTVPCIFTSHAINRGISSTTNGGTNKHQMEESTSVEKGPGSNMRGKTEACNEANQMNGIFLGAAVDLKLNDQLMELPA
uniref:Uncharacterized protein n=1 Tax=Oryza meridionalis TaxID=40149 RepID=A0A0E0CF38_9ORYZ